MKEDFLSDLAHEMKRLYGDNLEHVTLVFPNRRAGLFFTRALSQLITKPIWSPSILAIEDFVKSFSKLSIADPLSLLIDLFEVYKEKTGKDETFDQFYYWGEMLLRDFDEIDRYLVNPKHIFTAVKNLKEIDSYFLDYTEEQKAAMLKFWGVILEKESAHTASFIWFWQRLNSIYIEFNRRLTERGEAYIGRIYRDCCQMADNKQLTWDAGDIIFAGFNALTASEEKLIKHFIAERNARIYWDFDTYYLDDSGHEAGYFMRGYSRDQVFRDTFNRQGKDYFRKSGKSIRTIASSQYVEQVGIAGSVLNDMIKNNQLNNPERTVVVLPDETLLPNLLYNLPEGIQKINITMGFPLRHSSFYSLLDSLLMLLQKEDPGGQLAWLHYHAVLRILNHPFIQGFQGESGNELVKNIQKRNMIYIPASLLRNHPVFEEIFRLHESSTGIFALIREFIVFIRTNPDSKSLFETGFEKEFSIVLFKLMNRLESTFKKTAIPINYEFVRKLLQYFSNSEKIPFTGEPLEGLQVMGLLETRNLDFDHVIMLCVNEGTIPGTSSLHSYIPYNVRKAYGLPNPDSRDAIYSYLFYRILQRAENITLIYHTEDNFARNAEPSRYIYQLKFESGYSITNFNVNSEVGFRELIPVVIQKEKFIQDRLKNYTDKFDGESCHFTASALNNYLACPITFAYKYIFDISEKEEISEDLDAASFGNILHHVMELAYKDYIDKTVVLTDILNIKKSIDQYITMAFAKVYGREDESEFKFEGRNIIGREVIRKFILKILANDEKDTPFKIIGLEKRVKAKLPVRIGEQIIGVNLKGFIDRIDEKDGALRIIDYKTGKDKAVFNDIPSLFDASDKNRNKAVFQTMLYAWMYLEETGANMPVISCLYNAQDLFTKDFDIRVKIKNGSTPLIVNDVREYIDPFITHLQSVIQQIFDPGIPFRHYDDTEECVYCKYSGLPSELGNTDKKRFS